MKIGIHFSQLPHRVLNKYNTLPSLVIIHTKQNIFVSSKLLIYLPLKPSITINVQHRR